MKKWIIKCLSYEKRLKIIYKIRSIKVLIYPNNLSKIADLHKTDKYGTHFYTPHYQYHFKSRRYNKIKLLEIGVGGYEDPFMEGNSLLMWKSFFPFAKIFAIDIYDKSFLEESRIKIYQESQIDLNFLDNDELSKAGCIQKPT